MRNFWRRVRAELAIGVAVLICPCHLPFTIPMLLSVTAGTSVGAILGRSSQALLVFILLSIAMFLGALYLTFAWIGGGQKTHTGKANGSRINMVNFFRNHPVLIAGMQLYPKA